MPRLLIRSLLLAVLLCVGLPARTGAAAPFAVPAGVSLQGPQMVADLVDFSNRYWARTAGMDTGLPPHINGHDEFVADWTQRMLAALHGLPVGVFRQPFPTPGFRFLPARKPAENVVVAVAGARHPDQAVVLGAHPDGEPWSKGSTYDDTSGCVILLGLARALGDLWRSHGLPSRTVEFVLFDAEEQGLIGSGAYAFAYQHGALMPRPVFMIDEEQSGVGYPVRPFGLLSAGPLPSYAWTTLDNPGRSLLAQVAHGMRAVLGAPKMPSPTDLTLALQRLTDARTPVFSALHGVYPTISYRGGSAPTFTPADESLLVPGPSVECCSDNVIFEWLGLPTVTFTGEGAYYTREAKPWSYPFDQPEDTPEALACDTGGSPQPGQALEAALVLPLALSEQMVEQYAPPDSGHGIAVFALPASAGHRIRFLGVGRGRMHWTFGDGATASGASAGHAYARAGTYSLTVHAGHSTRSLQVKVGARQPVFHWQFIGGIPGRKPWAPGELQTVAGCH